ncbi:MAG: hypothetical protein ABEJ31_10480 [Haloarculaceae archaeon]
MSPDAVRVGKRPSPLAAGVAVLVAAAVVAALAPPGDGHVGLGVELLGVAVLAGGYALVRRGWRATGALVVLVGLVVALGGLAVVAGRGGPSRTLELLPGAVGMAVLALGLIPYRGNGSRGALKVGAGLLFVGVLAAGLFRDVTLRTLLLSGVGTVVAWDAGDHAIGVGEQLGRRATTRRSEAVHVGGSLLVGAVAVTAGEFVADLGSPAGSLTSLSLLLVAVVCLTAALHG